MKRTMSTVGAHCTNQAYITMLDLTKTHKNVKKTAAKK
jgi:hypothetical protein